MFLTKGNLKIIFSKKKFEIITKLFYLNIYSINLKPVMVSRFSRIKKKIYIVFWVMEQPRLGPQKILIQLTLVCIICTPFKVP